MSLRDHLDKKTDKYWVGSKEKLKSAMKHKIKRTFVGSLEILESELRNQPELYKRVRAKILSLGNDQVRNMEVELEKYNIEFIPYHIEFRSIKEKDDEGKAV